MFYCPARRLPSFIWPQLPFFRQGCDRRLLASPPPRRRIASSVGRPMADKYASFSELAMSELEGRDFQVRLRKRNGVAAVIAPHGGGIEPGTSELADVIAASDFSFYAFEGIKAAGNRRNLH